MNLSIKATVDTNSPLLKGGVPLLGVVEIWQPMVIGTATEVYERPRPELDLNISIVSVTMPVRTREGPTHRPNETVNISVCAVPLYCSQITISGQAHTL